VPTDWHAIAEIYSESAEGFLCEDQLTKWHHLLAAHRRRQAARADWLYGQPAAARRLALELWTVNDRLSIADAATVVGAVLSEPTSRPPVGGRDFSKPSRGTARSAATSCAIA
jgi:hypothetical protein